jgi:hypothetical protein
MKNSNFYLTGVMFKSILFIACLLTAKLLTGQLSETSGYIPQITITADPGFGPYIAGTHQLSTIVISDLPQHTSSVMFRFIDSDGNQVGDSQLRTGTDMTTDIWQKFLDDFDLPLSPQVHIELTYQGDSIADYYVAYTVYPDTLSIQATAGWGPIATNNYLRINGWPTAPNVWNTFTVTNLPPRTYELDFLLYDSDSSVIEHLYVTPPAGQFLDTAIWSDVMMSNQPLNTKELQILIFCNGGPDQGLIYHNPLSIVMINPKLTCVSEGVTLTDSIATVVHNPVDGQALSVDSVKYVSFTNGPGIRMTESPYNYKGPYSLNMLDDECCIEGWILIDGKNLAAHQDQSQSFIRVDSLFDLSIFNEEGTAVAMRLSSLIPGDLMELAYIEVGNNILNNIGWHHFAVVLGDPVQGYLFYIDGNLMGAAINNANINYIWNNFNIHDNLKTKPLILGGCNARNKGKQPDHSFILGFDEIRIWNHYRTKQQIQQNFNRPVLQDATLVGYWDFDDLRNHLNFVSDESFNNNSGILNNGASFVPEYTGLFSIMDTLTLYTSNQLTDSIKFSFVDEDSRVIDSVKLKVQNHKAVWDYDISTLPYDIRHLRIDEFSPDLEEGGFQSVYNLKVLAPAPLATPMCNWGTYYQSDTHLGDIINSIHVNGFPANTTRVELGLMNGSVVYNEDVFTQNSVPYQYSLTLNGTDNYIKTASTVSSPSTYEISLWFKTTTTQGGMLIGLCDNPDGIPVSVLDRQLVMRKDGSLYYSYETMGPTDTLFGANKFNDGSWHCVTVSMYPPAGASMAIDGCVVDNNYTSGSINYQGWWVIGRHHQASGATIAEFFHGSLAYISINSAGSDAMTPVDLNLLNGAHRGTLLYKLDEGGGTMIHDTQGTNNGTLVGMSPNWTRLGTVTDVTWQHNMLDKPAGQYTFYANVYYPGGGESGIYYPLGIYNLKDPLPGHSFSYYMLNGLGYFNEGVTNYNKLFFSTDYNGQGNPGWTLNYLHYFFMSPDHQLIDQNELTWTASAFDLNVTIDMGDAPPGSYIDFQIGYKTSTQNVAVSDFQVPILIRQMMAPLISGDFGPFKQAVAPGTMKQPNTFVISTGEYNDLTKMTAGFYDGSGNEVTSVNGIKINNTTWTITQDMSVLPPPVTTMKISYYLGSGEFLALVAGPYKITINRTRPDWFDFLGDTAFANIVEYPDSVTFQITTPFESSSVINNAVNVKIPDAVPLIGGTSSSLEMPGAEAYLKYDKTLSRLELDEPPDFFQKYVDLGAGNGKSISLKFNYSQNNSYQLDQYDNLLASQNFSMGGSVTSGFQKMTTIVKRIQDLIQFIEDADPESVIVKPTFSLGYSGSFQYSSRLHLMVDTVSGKWGSFGNLDVDADPAHEEAFKNSSSYHFYSGSLGMEFSVGMSVFEGLASGNFGIDGRIVLGFGHSYVNIPSYKDQLVKSLAFQTYARFYIDLLWGWYEHTVWGPKMIYTLNLWGDDMNNDFPPAVKSEPLADLATGLATANEMVRSFRPVSTYCGMPRPKPQSGIISTSDALLFNWLEKGENAGQRNLRSRYFDLASHRFSDKKTIESNYHALNSPVSDKRPDGVAILAWAQSRHSVETFSPLAGQNELEEFFRSQDIYFSVYDNENDSIIHTGMLEDELITLNDGRAEGNPKVTMLSPSRALIIWQVVDPDIPQADIWYAFLDNDGTQWVQSIQGVAVAGEDVETQVKLVSAGENQAALVWLNTSRNEIPQSTVRASIFDGSHWSQPVLASVPGDTLCNYLDLKLQNETGAIVYTVFVEDPVHGNHEKLKLVPWKSGQFSPSDVAELFVDSVNHIQLPSIALDDDGKIAIGVKTEKMVPKQENLKISQVDIFHGDMNNLKGPWEHIPAHPFVCDTTKEISELNLAFAGNDTLVLLSQEYPMLAVNAPFIPQHGISFGDPYMNLVLRSFAFDQEGDVVDVDENEYFLGVPETPVDPGDILQVQCYPNPCIDHTTLSFSIVQATDVRIGLYDMRGIRVAGLIDRHLPAGSYELEVDAGKLEAGSYIFRVETKNSVSTVKLVVDN